MNVAFKVEPRAPRVVLDAFVTCSCSTGVGPIFPNAGLFFSSRNLESSALRHLRRLAQAFILISAERKRERGMLRDVFVPQLAAQQRIQSWIT